MTVVRNGSKPNGVMRFAYYTLRVYFTCPRNECNAPRENRRHGMAQTTWDWYQDKWQRGMRSAGGAVGLLSFSTVLS